ncbi:DUF1223 domain-containing protein [Actimicrobium antarcticum]|uniref:DUF1223 domain-containing protein n=1 Tax=Actimicrobium antarcticum TaxID=1051899 RepID=UPI0031E1ACF2
MHQNKLLVLGISLVIAAPSYANKVCEVKSGTATAALIELYTSEGCSSCPPADRTLNDLRRQVGSEAVVVPLALHVSYWDSIGWIDSFAQKTFDSRQRKLLENQQHRVVYTPQFFVNGSELRSWSADLPAAIRRINAKTAPVEIGLKSTPSANGTVLLDANVTARDAHISGMLYVAVSESGLVRRVLRGENSGATLQHDNAVRLLFGPIPLEHGSANLSKEISLPASWNREHLKASAFVQDGSRILQAVSTAQCDAPRGL